MKIKVKTKTLCYISIFLYFCALSGHGLDSSLDQGIQIITFVIFLFASFISYINCDSDGKMAVKVNGMTKWYALFTIFSFLSFLWAVYSKDAVFYYYKRMLQLLGVLFCIPLFVENEEDIERMMSCLLYAYVYSSVLLVIRTPFHLWGTERMGADIGIDPNLLGTRMAVGAIMSLYLFLKYSEKKYVIILLDMVAVSFFSGSRKALFMVIMGISSVELFCSDSRKIGKIFYRVLLTLLILCFIFYLIFSVDVIYNILGSRVERALSYFVSGGFDGSARERAYYISVARELFRCHPVLGIGLNNFKSYMAYINYHHVAYCHSNYWELLSCLGIVGTVIFYSFHITLFIKLIKKIKKSYQKIHVLGLIILILYMICDYANVSYMNILQYITISLAYVSTKITISYVSKNLKRGNDSCLVV